MYDVIHTYVNSRSRLRRVSIPGYVFYTERFFCLLSTSGISALGRERLLRYVRQSAEGKHCQSGLVD